MPQDKANRIVLSSYLLDSTLECPELLLISHVGQALGLRRPLRPPRRSLFASPSGFDERGRGGLRGRRSARRCPTMHAVLLRDANEVQQKGVAERGFLIPVVACGESPVTGFHLGLQE